MQNQDKTNFSSIPVIHMTEVLARENFVYLQQTMKLKQDIEKNFIVLAKRLKEIRDKERFRPNYDNFQEYTDDLHLDYTKAVRLIEVYEMFILKYNIPKDKLVEVGWSKLSEVTKLVKTKREALSWVNKAKLSKNDLRIEILEAKSGITQEACKHPDTYTIRVCRVCKLRAQEHEAGKEKK
jgi:hypothetical protein